MPALDISLQPQNDARRTIIMALPGQMENDFLPPDVADALSSLWMDPGVREAVRSLGMHVIPSVGDAVTIKNKGQGARLGWRLRIAKESRCRAREMRRTLEGQKEKGGGASREGRSNFGG